jgi:hypothetical protein
MIDVGSFVRLAVDPVRLAILGKGATGPVDVEEIAAALGVPPKRVERELGKLVEAGLVVDGRLDQAVLRDLARSLPQDSPADASVFAGTWGPDEAKVLATFFQGGRLASIPAQHSKRLVVLERLAQEFEPGVRYREREVDTTLQMFHPDHAALRRSLVDEGFMTRADGVYWRTGGRTE